MDNLIFTLNDVRTIRLVSLNIEDFDVFALEVQTNYLQKLIGDSLYLAMTSAPGDPRFVKLIDGTNYAPGGRTVIFRGVKRYCCYLWLYRYISAGALNMTPVGPQIFNDPDSTPAIGGQDYRNETRHYIAMADALEEPILQFLSYNQGEYPEFHEGGRVEQAESDNIEFRAFGGDINFDLGV